MSARWLVAAPKTARPGRRLAIPVAGERLWPLLLPAFFALLAVVFFGPALFGGGVLLPVDALFLHPPWRAYAAEFGISVPHNHLIADTILQNYSWKALAAAAYAAGEFPLWNPYILAGQPFLAAGQNGSLYPLGVLYYLLPEGRAYAPFVALHSAIAGLLTYWLVRVLGGSRFGGAIGGVSFAFCGYLVVSVLWPMVVSTAVWLPGVLAVVELLVRVGTGAQGACERVRLVPLLLAGAAMVTLQFLAGHLEMSLYLLATAGLYAGLRLASRLEWPFATRSAGQAQRGGLLLAAAALFGMVALGTLGAAVQLAPFVEAIGANVRVGQVSYDDVRGYAMDRSQLLAFIMPDWFGNPSHHDVFDLFRGDERPVDRPIGEVGDDRWGTEWGRKNYVEGTAYVGILPLLLAGVALVRRRDGPTWTLTVVAAVSLLLAFGTPLYSLLFFGVPGVSQLHTPFRWVYPYSLCIAVLAGLGATCLERGRRYSTPGGMTWSAARCRGFLLLGGLAVLVLAVVLLAGLSPLRDLLLGQAARAIRRSGPLQLAFPDAQSFYSYAWANAAGLALLLLSASLVLLLLARRAPLARGLALGILVGDLFTFGMSFNTVSDPAPLRWVPPGIAAITADGGLYRIATLGEADLLPANTGMLFGLQDIRGYDTIILREYVQFLELVEPQTGLLYSKVHKLLQPRSLESPLLDFLNLKYVLTTERLDSAGWELIFDGETRVYRNRRALPRAVLVPEAILAQDAADALRLVGQPAFDPRRQVVLEGVAASPSRPESGGAAVLSTVEVREYGLNRVVVEIEAPTGGYLVLSDVYFPGWAARLDGAEVPLLRANRAFRAVEVGPGHHQAVFEYRPFSFRVGGLLSLLAVGLAGLTLGAWAYGRAGLRQLGNGSAAARVAKNSLFPLTTGLLNKGLDFAFALVYLRLLGPQGTGAFTFAVVVVGYFDILVNFGLGTLLTRQVARNSADTDRYVANTLSVRLGLATVALLIALALAGPLAAPLQIEPSVGLAIVLFTLGLLPGALASTASAVFQARERMEVPAAVTVLGTLVRIGLGTLALLGGWGVVGLAVVSLIVNLLNAAVLGGLMIALTGRLRLAFDARFSGGLLVTSWPLMLNNLLNSIFFRIDAVLLKPLAGDVALGHYSTAYKFIDGLQIIPSTFVMALFPLLSRQALDSREALARAMGLGLKVLLTLALPIAVGTTLLADEIIGLLAGPAYLPDSATALRVLIWFLPLSFVNGLTQYVLIALNRQRWITISFFAGALLNLGLNLVLIPRYGFLGAAAVTVASEWILFAPFWYALRKDLPPPNLLVIAWRPALAALVMGLCVVWARDLSPVLAIPVGAAVYLACLLALGVVRREELRALRGAA